MKNKYRIINSDKGDYIEVKMASNKTFLCDIDDLKYVEEGIWGPKNCRNTYYVYGLATKDERKIFHRHIKPWGDSPEWEQVDHINGNGWDNRRSNLRDGSGNINNLNQKLRSDNVSKQTGVHYSEYGHAWVVQWQEDGKRKTKSFTVCDHSGKRKKGNNHKLVRTREQAKQMAIDFRKEKDKKLGYTNGHRKGSA